MLDKKTRSEQIRLESLKRREEEKKKQNALIASSLKDVDKVNTKKIVFQDSDNDSDGNQIRKKVKLFDDDNDEDMELVVSRRHEGKSGAKLMKLESKFGDSRFKLDSKFASESDDEEEIDEISIERNKNRQLLSKVLGKELEAPTSSASIARPFTRFDPENQEHVEWMKTYGQTDGKKKEPSESDESEEEPENGNSAPVKSNFFSLDKNFADELREKASGDTKGVDGFSFLRSIGRNVDSEENTHFFDQDGNSFQNTKSRKSFVRDDSELASEPKKVLLSAPTKFFLTGNEPHIRSVVANFRQTQSIEKTVGNWSNYRNAIMKIYRHKRKTSRKQQKDREFHNRKKTQNGDS